MSKYEQLSGSLTDREDAQLKAAHGIADLGLRGAPGTYTPVPRDHRPEVHGAEMLKKVLIHEREEVRRKLGAINVVRIPKDKKQIYGRPYIESRVAPGLVWVKHS